MFTIQISGELEKYIDGVGDGLRSAQARGINRMLGSVQKTIPAQIADAVTAQPSKLNNHVGITKANAGNLRGEISIGGGKPIPLAAFMHSAGKGQVVVKVFKEHPAIVHRNAFQGSRSRQIYYRRQKRGGRLNRALGPTTVSIFRGSPKAQQTILDSVRTTLEKFMGEELEQLLEKGKAKGAT